MEAESDQAVDGDRAVWFTQHQARHPLLLALPLPPGAPACLLMLQAHVRDVMDAEAPTEERLEALMRLHQLVAECSPSLPGGFDPRRRSHRPRRPGRELLAAALTASSRPFQSSRPTSAR